MRINKKKRNIYASPEKRYVLEIMSQLPSTPIMPGEGAFQIKELLWLVKKCL